LEPFKINIATFEYFDKQIYRWITGCLIFAIIIAALINIRFFIQNQEGIKDYQVKIESLKSIIEKGKQQKGKQVKISENEKIFLKKNVEFINGIILRDIFPWPDVLDVIEKNCPRDVILDGVIYSGKLSEIIIEGSAPSTNDVAILILKGSKSNPQLNNNP